MLVDKDSILNEISKMTVMELVDFIAAAEKKFNVSAASIVQQTQSSSATTVGNVTEDFVQTEFKVTLENFGSEKIKVIKVVRDILKLGLKESKELVESAPVILKDSATKEEAETIKKEFELAGAVVSVK